VKNEELRVKRTDVEVKAGAEAEEEVME